MGRRFVPTPCVADAWLLLCEHASGGVLFKVVKPRQMHAAYMTMGGSPRCGVDVGGGLSTSVCSAHWARAA